ncbi:MAG: hypothetical protein EBS09_10745 [Flavobacteriia bacterium]|nr:hypothetical protein [Flavobacteriia bacterium]
MRFYFLLLLLLGFLQTAQCQFVIDDFDSQTANWLSTASGSQLNLLEVISSNLSINNNSLQVVHYDPNNPWASYTPGYTYGNNQESSIKYRYFQTSNHYNVRLSFSWLCNGESNNDYGTLYYSNDAVNWNIIKKLQSGQGDIIQTENLKLPKCYDNGGFYIGFSFTSDNSFNFQPGLVIDDISLFGNQCFTGDKPPKPVNPTNLIKCYSDRDAVGLSAFSSTGNLRWYSTISGCDNYIHEGMIFYTLPTATKTFYVTSYNGNNGCESSNKLPVTLTTQPLPSIVVDNVVNANLGGDGQISVSVSGTSPFYYYWSMNNDPTYSETIQDVNGLNEGNYQLFVTDGNGCKDSIRVVVVSNAELNIPGGISPNGDGYNDVWKISGIEQWDDYIVELRNMRGELVYKQDATDNPSYVPFNGLNQQGLKLPTGDYTYFLSSKQRKKKYSGILSIKYEY